MSELPMVQQFLKALQSADRAVLSGLIADDCKWEVVSPSLAMTPRYGQDIVDMLVEINTATFEPGSMKINIERTVVR